ncbi:MAG TPA: glycosyltransferase family protein [Vicinamibacteria bacterium]|nr:glycosyltransferase family protein [Vicinamibacteria bacterium]
MTAPVWIVVSARMASSRCPGKALAPLAGRPLLEVLLDRMASVRGVDGVVLATSVEAENDPLADVAGRAGFQVFRGDEDDVLRRHVDCARALGADHVVRVTGDNPLTDVETIESLVARHRGEAADYTYVPGDALLMGILAEVISRSALERSWERGDARHRSELMTLYIKEQPQEFAIAAAELPPGLYRPEYRLTVDEPEDVRLMQEIFVRLAAPGRRVTTREAIALLDREPALARINAKVRHKAANLRSVALDAGIGKIV